MRISKSLYFLLLCCAAISFSTRAEHLDFIANQRQWPDEVRYQAAVQGGSMFLTSTGFVYSYFSLEDISRVHARMHEESRDSRDIAHEPIRCHAYRVRLIGCNAASLNSPQQRLPNHYNFFLGNDTTKWADNVPAFEKVSYGNVYKGISLDVYSNGLSPKYDFIVSPHADASQIRLTFEGVVPTITAEGDLLLKTSVNEVIEKAPYAYQIVGGRQQEVKCRYSLKGGRLSFVFPNGYDRSRTLVIDPSLVFATYSGSTSITFGWSAAYDTSGDLYAGGQCFGTGWPATFGAFSTTFGGKVDASVNKYSSNGTSLLYSTYFGGDSADYPNTMLVNKAGELIIAGATQSVNLPTKSGCFDNSFNGGTDVYVMRFNAAGNGILGSTFLGGSGQEGNLSTSLGSAANRGELVTDTSGNIYVAFATNSGDFPTTPGAYQTALHGTMDAFVAKLNASCSNLLFSTYLGGTGDDAAICMELGPTGDLIVGGGTTSANFPGVSGGWQTVNNGNTDGFIAVLGNSGSSLLRATYVGTAGTDEVSKLQLDASGNIYATGINSTGLFPVTPGVYSDSAARDYIIKFDPALKNRMASTTIGGMAPLMPSAFLVDLCGNIYFIGFGGSGSGLPLTSNAFQTRAATCWLAVLNPNMASLRYASYMGDVGDHIDGGSSRLDPSGMVYHSVCSDKNGQPTTPSVWSPTRKTGGFDIASWKFDFQLSGMKAGFDIGPDTVCAPVTIKFNNTSVGALSYSWDFGDGSPTSTLHTPAPHAYLTPGAYRIRLYTYNSIACTPIDSAFHTIHVFDRDTVKLVPGPLTICGNDSSIIKVKPNWNLTVTPAVGVRYQPSGGTEIVFFPDVTTSYVVTASSPGPCHIPPADTIRFTIIRDTTIVTHLNPMTDTMLCNRDTAVYQLGRKRNSFSIQPTGYFSVSKDSLTIKFFPPVSTRYQFTAVKTNKCESIRDTLNFTIHRASVKAAFELTPKIADQKDPNLQLVNKSSLATSYEWFLNDSYWTSLANPAFLSKDTGTYCFTLLAKNDFCVDTAFDCGRIVETHIYIPSAFSPNGDGKNDFFRPILNNVTILEFSVYNRYGERVHISNSNDRGWDGKFNGEPCDLDVYFYKLKCSILGKEQPLMKGDVTLVR